MRKLGLVLVFLVLTGCGRGDVIQPAAGQASLVLAQLNHLRVTGCHCGDTYMPPVPPLGMQAILQTAAAQYAQQMYREDFFSHSSPDGVTPYERVRAAGFAGAFRSEIIARGYTEAATVVAAWRRSPGHCLALMDAESGQAGIGFYENYWVVDFGR